MRTILSSWIGKAHQPGSEPKVSQIMMEVIVRLKLHKLKAAVLQREKDMKEFQLVTICPDESTANYMNEYEIV